MRNCKQDHENTILTFYIAEKKYGLSFRYIKQIVSAPNLTHIPELPYFYKGVMYFNGNIVPVLDCKIRLDIYDTKPKSNSVVIIDFNNMIIGLLVDKIAEIVPGQNILGCDVDASYNNRFTSGIKQINGENIGIIDCERLIK